MICSCLFISMIGNTNMVMLNCVNDVCEVYFFFDHLIFIKYFQCSL